MEFWLLIAEPPILQFIYLFHTRFSLVWAEKGSISHFVNASQSAGSVHLKKNPGTYFIVISKFKCISSNKPSHQHLYINIFFFFNLKCDFVQCMYAVSRYNLVLRQKNARMYL